MPTITREHIKGCDAVSVITQVTSALELEPEEKYTITIQVSKDTRRRASLPFLDSAKFSDQDVPADLSANVDKHLY